METPAFQDYYSGAHSYCFGCGTHNDQGMKIKTYWDGDTSVTRFKPLAHHTALPGYVYGGLIASLIDCHCTGTAAAAAYQAEGRAMDTHPPLRYVTASLHVDYLRPTPMGVLLEVRGTVEELRGRKAIISATVSANGKLCARGKVVAVKLPDTWK